LFNLFPKQIRNRKISEAFSNFKKSKKNVRKKKLDKQTNKQTNKHIQQSNLKNQQASRISTNHIIT